MAKTTVTYYVDVDSTGAVTGWRKAGAAQDTFENQVQKTSKSLLSLDNIGRIAAAGGVGLVLQRAVSRSIEKGKEFETQLASLEAITGITGTQLDRLGSRSLQLSKIYGTSASNIIEANKLVASQLAQKIDFGTEEGFQTLQKVSEEAVVLSKAAGIELEEAVQATTMAINQFNLSADESARVINTMAAGSKYGAAEVPGITSALINAGSAAAGADDNIESVNAQIQILAANGQVGERAGTALRAMYLRLQTAGEDLAKYGIENVDLKANGMIKTLKQLNPILDDAAALKQIFGEEAFNAASILIREADAVESMAEKVTGSNVAYEQAAVRMDTFEGATDRLWAVMDGALIPAFQESNGLMVSLINNVAGLIEQFAGGISVINQWLDTHSDLRKELLLQTSASDAQARSVRSLREELARAAMEKELTAEKEEELREAYERTNDYLFDQISAIEIDTLRRKKNRDAIKDQIAELQKSSDDNSVGVDATALATIRELTPDLEKLNLEIANNEARVAELRKAYDEGTVSFEHYIEALKKANSNDDPKKNTEVADLRTLAGLQKELNDEKQKFLNATTEAERDAHNQRMEQLQAEIDGITAKYEKEKKKQDEIKADLVSIQGIKKSISEEEKAYIAATSDADREKHAATMTELYELLEQLDIVSQKTDDDHAKKMEQVREYFDYIGQGFNTMVDLFSVAIERRIDDLEREKEQRLENVNAELAAENLSEDQKKELLKKREKIEEEYAKKIQAEKRKQFNLDKAANVFRAAMQTALGIIEALPNVLLAAVVGSLGALQTGVILAQPNPYEKGGPVFGKRHSQGGTLIEAEEGEYVINRNSTRAAYPLIKRINEDPGFASRLARGLPTAAQGGMIQSGSLKIDLPSITPAGINSSVIAEAVTAAMDRVEARRPAISIGEMIDKEREYKRNQDVTGNEV